MKSDQVVQNKMDDIDRIQVRIKKGGKIMSIYCVIAMIVSFVSAIASTVALIAVAINNNLAVYVYNLYSDNEIYRILSRLVTLSDIPNEQIAMIGCFIVVLSQLPVFLLFKAMHGMMKHLSVGEKPFDVGIAKKIRRSAYVMLVLFLYNIPVGLFAFVLTFLFSYIMEYGAYIQKRADQTNRIQEEIIVSFAEITENKSGQTGQHIKRVSEYSKIIAQQLGLPASSVENVRIASTMHDVGKLLIPSEILEKPGRLTDEEFAIIKKHTVYGGQLLENVEGRTMVLSRTIALQHHERYDGKGYPEGKVAADISIEGRIVAVADVFDALTSKRSYKEAWSEEDAYHEIIKGRGTQFDPQVVDAFVAARDKIQKVRETFRDM